MKVAYFFGTLVNLVLWGFVLGAYLIAAVIASPFMLIGKIWKLITHRRKGDDTHE